MESSGGEDRISALPDAIIHHIFSYLNMTEVVHTCVLSKRWRSLWLSTPVLNFDISAWTRACGGSNEDVVLGVRDEKRLTFINFVDMFFINKGNRDNILEFNLYSYGDYFDPHHLFLWMILALTQNAKHISVNVPILDTFELPHNLFTSAVENIILHFTSLAPVRLPNSICTAAGVKSLDLDMVVFPSGDDNGELILSCPLLRHLKLNHCSVERLRVLTIRTPLLEILKLNYFSTNKDTSCRVRPFAPNLKSLMVIEGPTLGRSIVDYSIEDNFTSLVSAEIYVNSRDTYDLLKLCSAYMSQILPWVCNVRDLVLSICSVKAITESPKLMETLPDLFPNLKSVKLINWFWAPGIDAVLNFLERLPHIETLIWERDWTPWSSSSDWRAEVEGGDWGRYIPFQRIFRCLKTFEIRRFEASEVELKFIFFLLSKAVHLEKAIINCDAPKLPATKLSEYKMWVSSLPRASSGARVIFQLER